MDVICGETGGTTVKEQCIPSIVLRQSVARFNVSVFLFSTPMLQSIIHMQCRLIHFGSVRHDSCR